VVRRLATHKTVVQNAPKIFGMTQTQNLSTATVPLELAIGNKKRCVRKRLHKIPALRSRILAHLEVVPTVVAVVVVEVVVVVIEILVRVVNAMVRFEVEKMTRRFACVC
jgi:hypothetical protein